MRLAQEDAVMKFKLPLGKPQDAARRGANRSLQLALAITALLTAGVSSAQPELLSLQTERAFRQTHPCPLTGLTHDACSGWVIVLIKPRCADGVDDPANMQWLTTEQAKDKADAEARLCPAAATPARR
jgi:hypothetical protein